MAAATIDYDKLAQQHGGTVAVDYDALAAQHGGTATDTRSLLQKAKDNFNANTQGAKPGDGAIKGFIENIGQGGGQFIRSLAHPIDSAHAEVNAIEAPHPLNRALAQAHTEVDAARADPSRAIGNAIGQIGTGAILSGAAGEAVSQIAPTSSLPNLMSKFPTKAKAGEIFNKLNTDLAQQPVVIEKAAAPLQRAIEIGARGGSLPGPVDALLKRVQATEPMTFTEARDYQASLSDLSASDKLAMSGRMRGAVAQLNQALYQDIRQAAESGGGYGADFDKAMTQYRQASQIANATKAAIKYGGRAAAGAAGAGVIYKVGQEIAK